ncbi:MAG: AGE family epimerase/isomerase, partial [Planctomycetota bacterium]
MDRARLESLRDRYRDDLLCDVLPFWWPRAVDTKHGGFFTAFDRDGTLVDSDKAIWAQGRFSWLLGSLARDLSDEELARTPFADSPNALRDGWLDAAEAALEFVERHGTDTDGQLFFLVTADGRPLRKRRYAFSEAFAAIGHAAVARAGRNSRRHAAAAERHFDAFIRWTSTPGLLEPKVSPETRPMYGIGVPMIT